MVKKVVAERQRTYRARYADRGEDGFTLLEMVCVLAVVALLAAIALPAMRRNTSRPELEGYAVRTAALLMADRNAALRRRAQISTLVEAPERYIRSGATGQSVRLPNDVSVGAMLAATCAGRPSGQTVDFFPSGMSCGGVVTLARPGMGYEIRVNWLTGGVEIVPQTPR
jgi:general secretion pathway protein H